MVKILKTSATQSDIMRQYSSQALQLTQLFYPNRLLEEYDSTKSQILKHIKATLLKLSATPVIESSAMTSTEVTSDDIHIIEYIGGYILQRLTKKSKCDTSMDILKSFTSKHLISDSLINSLQNDEYGNLTIPIHAITQILLLLETKFRENLKNDDIMHSVSNNLNMEELLDMLPEIGSDNKEISLVLTKICTYYLKIRAHQKAKKLNKTFKIQMDQNVSLRKSLKKKVL